MERILIKQIPPFLFDEYRENDLLKLKLLSELSRNPLTPSTLASRLDCKYETVKKALLFFEKLGVATKETRPHGKKIYEYYKLTGLGEKISAKKGKKS